MTSQRSVRARRRASSVATVGLDLGDRHSNFCVIDGRRGECLEQGKVQTNREAMRVLFARLAPAQLALEVGTHSPWVSRLAEAAGLKVLLANPRKVALISENERKNDQNDAELLARAARFDPKLLHPLQHRSLECQQDLAVHRARLAVVCARTRLINHVRGQLKSFGYRVQRCSADSFAQRALLAIPKDLEPALLPIVRTIGSLTEQIKSFEGALEHIAEERYPQTKILRQVSGVGALISLCYVLTLGDASRIKRSRQAGPYLGLVPRKHDSGDSRPELSITKAGDVEMRRLLVVAANYILGRGPDCDLRRYGLKIAGSGSKNARKRAKVAVARKLAVLLHHLWRSGEVYDPFHIARRRGEAVPA
jgi:transposase